MSATSVRGNALATLAVQTEKMPGMTPGERITVITKIASALSGRSWAEIDLTLDQFGLPTSNSWQSDEYSYVVEHIKRADFEQS